MNLNQKLWLVSLMSAVLISVPLMISAQTSVVTPLSAERVQLLNQLRRELAVLQAKLETLKLQSVSVKSEIRLSKRMMKGTSDQEVRLLQALLATDPEIYPEGYQTGYFGLLTEKALKKLQKKAGLTETGEVDERTLWKINELLTEGAGHSGKIPPGLLRAPGILKKLGLATTTSPGQDTTAPIITGAAATSTTASSTVIVWQTNELTTGALHYATSTPVDSAAYPLLASDQVWRTSHQLALTNLFASTTYYYYLVATDYAGNHSTSTTASFTTLGQ
ncbi:MAG: peptidoglycan-binding protein [Candidatus Vogelbacteria bacterium]|nr:peptidoglycan-binding protein [Candidatus Vogelbacteria bacterium]